MNQSLIPTQEQFDKLLAWLDTDRDRAGEKYESIHRNLIAIFRRRGCHNAEELADETFNRVTQRIDGLLSAYEGEPARYIIVVARNVHLEYVRSKEHKISIVECPFRGLKAFAEQDARFFFGRDKFANNLLRKVSEHSFVIVVGPSGSGKSSVVQAGLLPRLRLEGRPNNTWEAVVFTPHEHPFLSLSKELMLFYEMGMSKTDQMIEARTLTEALLNGNISLDDSINATLKLTQANRLLLVVDQFEELFTVSEKRYQQPFVESLLAIATLADSPVKVMLILRAEFYEQLISFSRELSHSVQQGLISLAPMTRDELRQTIEGPAATVGLHFEAGLVEQLLRDFSGEPSPLPQLQLILLQLFEHRNGMVLTHQTYEQIRRLGNAPSEINSIGREYTSRVGDYSINKYEQDEAIQIEEGPENPDELPRKPIIESRAIIQPPSDDATFSPAIADTNVDFDETALAEEREEHAIEKIERFVQAFGEPYREFAYHLALPLVLTPELVNHIRTEFLLDQVGWVAEADLLLSDLCREVGYETYVMDEDVRALLLKQGRESLGDQRMKEVAHRVYNYLSHVVYSSPLLTAEDLKAERWQAMVYLDHHREAAAKEMAASFAVAGGSAEQAVQIAGGQSVNWGELARIAHLVQGVQEQLLQGPTGELARLVEYAGTAKQIADLRAGFLNPAGLQLQNLGEQFEVMGTKLVSPDDLIGSIGLSEKTPGTQPVLEQTRNADMPTMLAEFFEQRGETNRGKLLQEFVRALLEREHILESDQAQLTEGLALIAFEMQIRSTQDKPDKKDDALPTLPTEARVFLDERLLNLAVRAGILSVAEQVSFTHLSLQEYFAALSLDIKIQSGEFQATDIWLSDRWWQPSNWENPAILLAGLYSEDCSQVVEWVARGNPEVAAQCVVRSGAALADATKERLRAEWIYRLTDLKDDPEPKSRAAVGRALAIAGWDNRPGIGVIRDSISGVTLPDFDWVEIPGGEFQYGDDKANYAVKQQTLMLPKFRVSRYPVTYKQFQTFLDDPEGFKDRRWFKGLAAGKEERQIREQAFKFDNHSRETVNWYQVVAFCRWLSWRMGGGYDLNEVSDWAVRLPTEFEWEKAARGTDGRLYPYKGEYDPDKGNVRETGISQTSAVGIFPNGVSPYGVEEMSGNIWEWCLSDYSNPQLDAKNENLRKKKSRVLRGGSWYDFQLVARAVSRDYKRPGACVSSLGFRVVSYRYPSS